MTESNQTTPSITGVIVAKNEAETIVNSIETLRWCDDILVIDSGSTDETAAVAEATGVRVVGFSHPSMAKIRNEALKRIKTDWLFYLDADERVTPVLAREVMVNLETSTASALRLKRQNVHYGRVFRHGGWQDDYVTRVFKKADFQKWYGKIHESPKFLGELITLNSPLIHLTHRNTVDGLKKTISWTPIEAELLYKSGAQPVKLLTLLRKGGLEFIRRGIFKQGYRDGLAGWIEALVQGMNRMLVYIQLWELQQQPSLPETYQKIEQEIAKLWQQKS